jgi:hypothetical protein
MRKSICAALVILSVILTPASVLYADEAFEDPRDALWELVLSLQIANKPEIADKAFALFFNFLYSNDFTQQELDSMASFVRSAINAWNGHESDPIGETDRDRLDWLFGQATTVTQSIGATLSFDASGGKATIERGSRTFSVPINGISFAQSSIPYSVTSNEVNLMEAHIGDGEKVIKATGLALDLRPLRFLIGCLATILTIYGFVAKFSIQGSKEK